jgi:hypothetical protein
MSRETGSEKKRKKRTRSEQLRDIQSDGQKRLEDDRGAVT